MDPITHEVTLESVVFGIKYPIIFFLGILSLIIFLNIRFVIAYRYKSFDKWLVNFNLKQRIILWILVHFYSFGIPALMAISVRGWGIFTLISPSIALFIILNSLRRIGDRVEMNLAMKKHSRQ